MDSYKKTMAFALTCACLLQVQGAEHTLWYQQPADASQRNVSPNSNKAFGVKPFQEALPMGNGRIGALVYGGVADELIEFNEDSLWVGDEEHTGAYQSFGTVEINLDGQDDVSDYRRALDIGTALHTIEYQAGGVNYRREYFASHPDNALILHFSADKKGAYSGTIKLGDNHNGEVKASGSRIGFKGNLDGFIYGPDKKQGIKDYKLDLDYEAILQVEHDGGSIKVKGNQLVLSNVNHFTIYLTAGTDFVRDRSANWRGEHPHARLNSTLEAAAAKSYEKLKADHLQDYTSFFNRMSLDLGSSPKSLQELPTDERIKLFTDAPSKDPDMTELVYNYARYLMLASSRKGTNPANLQGIWSNHNNAPWHCDYHADVNIEMNYWFVDQSNLSECFEPLSTWYHSIRKARADQTRKYYKEHDNQDVRGFDVQLSVGLVGGGAAHHTAGAAAWIAQSVWDHYTYTKNKEYLKNKAYPVMKDICLYWQDRLLVVKDRKIVHKDGTPVDHPSAVWMGEPEGTLLAPVSKSPEHGKEYVGNSFEQQLIWDLLTNTIEASEDLGIDEEFRAELVDMKSRLLGPKIGSLGQLQEWRKDLRNPKGKIHNLKSGRFAHRHISHMLAVYPGRQISPITTPELAEAARFSIKARGKGYTTWSSIHRALVWARLHEGDTAYEHLDFALGRLFPNMLSYIQGSAFQIDANFGYAAVINEMLIQSHLGEIHLLPALPAIWSEGSVQGMKARGNFIIDQMSWNDSKLTRAEITSVAGGPCKLRTNSPVQVHSDGKTVSVEKLDDGAIRFPTKPGETFTITSI